MNRKELIDYCLTLPDTYEDYPFKDVNWTVIRSRKNRKVFAWIFERQDNIWINLKADPEWRDFWRESFEAVLPAYHLNKKHWNSLIMDGTIPEDTMKLLINESYDLVTGRKREQDIKRKGSK